MPNGADAGQVQLTADLHAEAAALANEAHQLALEAGRWRHPAWRQRLLLMVEDLRELAEGFELVAAEGDYWRMHEALFRCIEERRAAHLVLRKSTRQRESLYAPDPSPARATDTGRAAWLQ